MAHTLILVLSFEFQWGPISGTQDLEDRELRELAALTLQEDDDELDYRDDGYIELVLKILGLMCDGQNKILQVRDHTIRHLFFSCVSQ